MSESKKNTTRFWLWPLKLFITGCAFYYLYLKLFIDPSAKDSLLSLKETLLSPGSAVLSIALILLMILNWSVEAIKWKFMIGKIEKVSFVRALTAVLSGVTVSIFTPNRVGEFAGRVLYLREGNRVKGGLITIIQNFSQLTITIAGGFLSWFFIRNLFDAHFFVQGIAVTMIAGILIVALLILFNFSFIESVFLRIKWFTKWKEKLDVLSIYSSKEILILLSLSALRYCVFCLQFWLAILLFGLHITVSIAFPMIAFMYFMMTIIPTMGLTEFPVRGAVATSLFQYVNPDPVPVVCASFTIWIINLALPAVAGGLLLLKPDAGK